MSVGVISMGIRCPIIRQGDNLQQIVIDSILKTTELEDGDIIGITESIVARAQGNYVTVDEVAKDTVRLFGKDAEIVLEKPIYSRNRFSMILKGIARAAKKIILIMPPFDEVGNPSRINPWTEVNIQDYYKEICESENCEVEFSKGHLMDYVQLRKYENWLYCGLHDYEKWKNTRINQNKRNYTLADYFPGRCQWGLLGSNKANEETLKLFPDKAEAQLLVEGIQRKIKESLNKTVSVLCYGDGCFKDPTANIWEFADPVTCPAYTKELEGSPYEIKLKAFADGRFKDLSGKELEDAIKKEITLKEVDSVRGGMKTQGTTPRRYIDLLASLMDLTSGSGDKGTPIVLVKNYFKNYAC